MTDKDKKVNIVLCPCVKSEYCPIHSDKDRVEEVLHHIDNQLNPEAQAVLALVGKHITIEEYELHRNARLAEIVHKKDKVDSLLLTDEELKRADKQLDGAFYNEPDDAIAWLIDRRNIAKAQLKKVVEVVEWGSLACPPTDYTWTYPVGTLEQDSEQKAYEAGCRDQQIMLASNFRRVIIISEHDGKG